MANLFQEIEKLNHEQLVTELSVLDCVSVTNMAKTVTNRAVSKVFDMANYMLSAVTDNKLNYKGADSAKLLQYEKINAYMLKQTQELQNLYKEKIITRLSNLANIIPEASDDMLSVLVIEESAQLYRINECYTPYDKADMIHKAYAEQYIKHLHRYVKNLSLKEQKQLEEKIYSEIVKLPVDYRIRLKNTLCIPEFNRTEIGKAIQGARGKSVLAKLIEFIGYSAFDEVDVIISVTYDNVTDFNRPDRAVLAYVVWRLINFRGKGYRITDDVLPSYIISTDRPKEEKKEKEYLETAGEYNATKSELTRLRMEFEKDKKNYNEKLTFLNQLYSKRDGYKVKYEMETAGNQELEKYYNTAKAELDLYIDNNEVVDRKDARYKKLKEEFADISRKKKNAEKELMKLSTSIKTYFEEVKTTEAETDAIKNKLIMLEKRIDKLENNYANVMAKYERMSDFELYKLKTKWLTCFMELVFEENVLKNVVKDFNHAQIMNIERALKELIMTDDIMAYSNGRLKKKDSNLNYMTFVASEGNEGAIVFTKPMDSNKKAFIAAIVKNIKE